jgi:hypothetical protein
MHRLRRTIIELPGFSLYGLARRVSGFAWGYWFLAFQPEHRHETLPSIDHQILSGLLSRCIADRQAMWQVDQISNSGPGNRHGDGITAHN